MKKMMITGLVMMLSAGALWAQEQAAKNPHVILETNRGSIELELYPDKAPETVENYLQYVRDGFYDGTVFHRVIPRFMIQGGGYSADLQKKSTRPDIQNEANNGLRNELYTVAMARKSDPHTANSQFFINVANNQALDHSGPSTRGWGYAVFGKVFAGREVVDAIAATPTTSKGGMRDVPQEAVIVEKAYIVE